MTESSTSVSPYGSVHSGGATLFIKQPNDFEQQMKVHAIGSGSSPELIDMQVDDEVIGAAYKLKLKKRNELLQRIQNVKTKRAAIHTQNQTLSQLKAAWWYRYHQAISERTISLSEYERHQKCLEVLQADYQKLAKVNVLQDVFHIWHRGFGAFATINGLRIGM